MTEKRNHLKTLVNSSGYLFQLAVENEVRINQAETGWRVLTREHPWKNLDDDNEGFIDLVLGSGRVRLVVECKRPKGRVWVFVISDQQEMSVERFRIYWTYISPKGKDLVGWSDYFVNPESPESEFCVMRGSEDKEPILERLARNVLSSTEALALEEMGMERPKITHKLGVLIPAIITAAELKVCKVDPRAIRLSDGTIENPEFKTVPWIRFRKSLSISVGNVRGFTELSDISERKMRSIFVINSLSLSNFLKKLSYGKPISMGLDPWIVASQLEQM